MCGVQRGATGGIKETVSRSGATRIYHEQLDWFGVPV
jgi:hypothetical protein